MFVLYTEKNQIVFLADTIQPPLHTGWGRWGGTQYCPAGSYVQGANIKAEGSQGGGDDTSVNSVQLHCRKGSTTVRHITSSQGPWGHWRGYRGCRSGFIKGVRICSEPPQGGGKVGLICCYTTRVKKKPHF